MTAPQACKRMSRVWLHPTMVNAYSIYDSNLKFKKLNPQERNNIIDTVIFGQKRNEYVFYSKDLDGMMEYLRVQSYSLSNDPNQTFENGLFLG